MFNKANFKIQYLGVNIEEHYSGKGSFITTKLFTKLLIQLSSTGKMIYSNQELVGLFGCTERGLQIAAKQLEKYDLFHRVFTDETRYTRIGWRANLENIMNLLELKVKDVEELERGNIHKSIIRQMVIQLKKDRRALRRAITIAKRKEDKQRFNELMREKRELEQAYQDHLNYVINRHNKFNHVDPDIDMDQLIKEAKAVLPGFFNLVPPDTIKN